MNSQEIPRKSGMYRNVKAGLLRALVLAAIFAISLFLYTKLLVP
ncbi:MAG: hypothetical protein PHE86_02890 [Candidatus Marinimicrobia bacterium]|nr:hypothetical protein [Candidatus Neomarinimicrobiota bacterium]MDD5582720.1 hypothetical protein [Candidatus Neomarinimicrobiota bacterium]